MRKLVSIETIREIMPIDGADMIEIAMVKGWQAVVKKNVFKVGDPCVFFEVDSFLPVKPQYEFLRKSCYRNVEGLGEGFRIRSCKLRKTLSQGLIIPLDEANIYQESENVFKFTNEIGNKYFVSEETDLDELLEVKKYDPPVPAHLSGKISGNFPQGIRKTDQNRVQNLWYRHSHEILGHEFEVTLKLDGSSMTVFKTAEKFGVCSRNFELKFDYTNSENTFVKTALALGLDKTLPEGYAIQGELMGPGIQKNRENLPSTQFFVFDIQEIASGKYLTPTERHEFINTYLNIPHVPVIDYAAIIPVLTNMQDLLDYADNTKSMNNDIAEGLVFKRSDGQFSFKVISNKFLLESEE